MHSNTPPMAQVCSPLGQISAEVLKPAAGLYGGRAYANAAVSLTNVVSNTTSEPRAMAADVRQWEADLRCLFQQHVWRRAELYAFSWPMWTQFFIQPPLPTGCGARYLYSCLRLTPIYGQQRQVARGCPVAVTLLMVDS
jgi:hypothetical protein